MKCIYGTYIGIIFLVIILTATFFLGVIHGRKQTLEALQHDLKELNEQK